MNSVKPDSKDCLDIILTDFQLHVQKVRKPNGFEGVNHEGTVTSLPHQSLYRRSDEPEPRTVWYRATGSLLPGMDLNHDTQIQSLRSYR